MHVIFVLTYFLLLLIRLNPDDTVPDLIALEHCEVENEYDLHIPPFGMAFWLLWEIDLPFCQFSFESTIKYERHTTFYFKE